MDGHGRQGGHQTSPKITRPRAAKQDARTTRADHAWPSLMASSKAAEKRTKASARHTHPKAWHRLFCFLSGMVLERKRQTRQMRVYRHARNVHSRSSSMGRRACMGPLAIVWARNRPQRDTANSTVATTRRTADTARQASISVVSSERCSASPASMKMMPQRSSRRPAESKRRCLARRVSLAVDILCCEKGRLPKREERRAR